MAMGLGLLPAYWYFWRQPQSTEYAVIRKWVTIFLAVSVWYGFLAGHTANDLRRASRICAQWPASRSERYCVSSRNLPKM
jgi:hypothetical protein